MFNDWVRKLILDIGSHYDTQVWSKIGQLICLKHLFRSTAEATFSFIIKRGLSLLTRTHRVLSYLLKYRHHAICLCRMLSPKMQRMQRSIRINDGQLVGLAEKARYSLSLYRYSDLKIIFLSLSVSLCVSEIAGSAYVGPTGLHPTYIANYIL